MILNNMHNNKYHSVHVLSKRTYLHSVIIETGIKVE